MSYLTPEEVEIVKECREHEYCTIECPADFHRCCGFFDRYNLNPDSNRIRECPVCGRYYTDRPALSRRPGVGEICPECGQKEALEDYEQHRGAYYVDMIKEVLGVGKNDNH